jgi:hypothetical protein
MSGVGLTGPRDTDVNVPSWGNYDALMTPFSRLSPFPVVTGPGSPMRSPWSSAAMVSHSLRSASAAGSGYPG